MRASWLFLYLLIPSIVVAAPPSAMPKLRTGERKLVEEPKPLELRADGHALDAKDEILSLTVVTPVAFRAHWIARSQGGAPVLVFRADGKLWMRRPARDAARAIDAQVYALPESDRDPGPTHLSRATVSPLTTASDPTLRKKFGEVLVRDYSNGTSLFGTFAYDRLRARFASAGTERTRPAWRNRGTELERLMDTTTGMASIQEAIQADRPLWLQAAREKATVTLESLKPPPLGQHPFAEMLHALGRPVPEEKLAAATPAEFYYARLDDLAVFFRLVDQLDAWATPALNVLEGRGEDHALAARTLTQLGLQRTELARALGTQVVADLALVGSDPYVREGSDVTVIFRIKQRALFEAALAAGLAEHTRAHPATETKLDHAGVAIRVQRSTDGALRQHRASVGDLEVVSNSLAATRRVLDAIAGRTPRLSEQADFQYMLARDPGERTDGLVYLGDRFIAEVVGPRQKILEARRQLALSELLVPGFAALLFGRSEGRAPTSSDELIASGWLKKDELRHAGDGGAIAFAPGTGAHSSWGTPSALEPLYDLVAPKRVTASEKAGYERFAQSYQNYWQQYLDPILVRIGVQPDGKGTRMVADVRVLPLIEGTSYREIGEMAGRARLATPAIPSGLRAVFGIGTEARLRRELTQMATASPFGGKIALDWLGDWLFFGVEDRVETVRAAVAVGAAHLPQAPTDEEERMPDRVFADALQCPVYLAIGLHNMVGAALFLTAVKKFASDAAPGVITWTEGSPYKGTRLVHIAIAAKSIDRSLPDGANLWYALTNGALIFTLSESVLHHVLDERAGKNATRAVEPKQPGAQFVLDWASDAGAPLQQLLGWLLEAAGLESMSISRARADAYLTGAPGEPLRELALAYEGSEPLPPDGGHYTLGPEGVRDPVRGSAVLEKWPAVPVAGSPVERLLAAVARFRGEVGFDDEPKVAGQPAMRSLHARVVLGLRAPTGR
jgi:hypothetical protein